MLLSEIPFLKATNLRHYSGIPPYGHPVITATSFWPGEIALNLLRFSTGMLLSEITFLKATNLRHYFRSFCECFCDFLVRDWRGFVKNGMIPQSSFAFYIDTVCSESIDVHSASVERVLCFVSLVRESFRSQVKNLARSATERFSIECRKTKTKAITNVNNAMNQWKLEANTRNQR